MIDLSKADRKRQSSVWIGDEEYPIHTQFWAWIAFGQKLEGKKTIALDELDYLYQWRTPEDKAAGYGELLKFYENRQLLPRPSGKHSSVIAFDWEMDSEYICAAFIQQYGINLVETDLHFHDFLMLFNGLVDTKLNHIMSARYDDSKNGTAGAEMRHAWEIIKDAPDLPPADVRRKNMDWPTTA